MIKWRVIIISEGVTTTCVREAVREAVRDFRALASRSLLRLNVQLGVGMQLH